MVVLGIESTCDETSCSICVDGSNVLSNVISTQINDHLPWNGVVPEIASRLHLTKIVPVINEALSSAGKSLADIDLIAAANRPGLIGGLIVGTGMAKTLAWYLDVDFIAINHIEAHLYSPHITSEIPFPYIGLLVSGGHTMIVKCTSYTDYEVIGTTIDDATGEAFDKIAKHFNLGYPGGPAVEKAAQSGDPLAYNFPLSNLYKSKRKYDVSYSGIKTAAINFTEKYKKKENATINDIAASFQKRAFDILLKKVKAASTDTGINTIVIAGGVSANQYLRETFRSSLKNKNIFFPELKYATDNGAMIAAYAYHRYQKDGGSGFDTGVHPRVSGYKISLLRD